MPLGQALYFGVFHSVSIFNNAGFDLFGKIHGPFSGLAEYAGDPFVNIVVMALIVLGGIGFIVISDLVSYRRTRRLTLHSKVVLTMTLILTVVGALTMLAIESSNPHTLQPMSWTNRTMAAFFHSVSARSGGSAPLACRIWSSPANFCLFC